MDTHATSCVGKLVKLVEKVEKIEKVEKADLVENLVENVWRMLRVVDDDLLWLSVRHECNQLWSREYSVRPGLPGRTHTGGSAPPGLPEVKSREGVVLR